MGPLQRPLWTSFGLPLGLHFRPRWTQEEPRGAWIGPLELQEAKKEQLEKVSFSFGKTILSRLRGPRNALEISRKFPRNDQKTFQDPSKNKSKNRLDFDAVLRYFWASFWLRNGAPNPSKMNPKLKPKMNSKNSSPKASQARGLAERLAECPQTS